MCVYLRFALVMVRFIIKLNFLKIIMIALKKIFGWSTILLRNKAGWSYSKIIFRDIAQSSYFKPIIAVKDFLNEQKIKHEEGPNSYRIRECIFCDKPQSYDILNQNTLNVDKFDGKFLCSRCQKKGSWDQFKAKFLNIDSKYRSKFMLDALNNSGIIQSQYQQLAANLQAPKHTQTLDYLKSRGFTLETLLKYRVGAGTETFVDEIGKEVSVNVIYFPMYELRTQGVLDESNQVTVKLSKIKVRGGSSETKKFTRQFPSGPHSGFFGLNTIQKNHKFVVITEGEFDAMAVYQQTGLPAISLPQGATSLPDKLLPILNQFEKIVLWMDNDEAGKLGAEKISYKLGEKRTHIVKHDEANLKDANDFLKSAPQKMKELIELSKTKPGQSILQFQDYTNLVKDRIFKRQQFIGIKIEALPFFNEKVKGIRMQQITIVSGPTGCGKTTFLSQMSLDLAKKGIPVLWGSFQIRNEVLVTNMLIQYSGVNLFRNKNSFDHHAQSFTNLPIHWLNFHGSHDIEKVMSTIEYSIEKHNISFVVLDTLQFLLADQAQGIKKFDLQDKVMSRLRKIATNFNVHIVIVIHPRKTEENEDIQIHSIYGTSKAAQEADNIWMVQSRQNFRIFDVKKNRFDGEIGKVAMGYNKELRSFTQLTKSELLKLHNNEATMEDVLKQRAKTESQQTIQNQQNRYTLQSNQSSNSSDIASILQKKPSRKNNMNH